MSRCSWTDVERSVRFYVDVLGFQISDLYGEDMMPGGAAFVRLNTDHHGIALFKATQDRDPGAGLHHMAFEVGSLDEVFRVRDHLRKHDVPIHFEGRRRAGVQIAVEFRDPDGHNLEVYWGIDQIGSEGKLGRPASGRARAVWSRRSSTRWSGRIRRCWIRRWRESVKRAGSPPTRATRGRPAREPAGLFPPAFLF
jgi:catechol 2,3-dioxygenase-like lactoylglutathione lyase family enzyme